MSKPVFLEVQSFILKDFPLNGDVMIMMQGRIDTLFFLSLVLHTAVVVRL